MTNVQMRRDGDKLIVEVDLRKEFGRSASGKSTTIASTQGNKSVPGADNIKIGLNVYKQ